MEIIEDIIERYAAKELIRMMNRKVKVELELNEWELKIIDNIGKIIHERMFKMNSKFVDKNINTVRAYVISELIEAYAKQFPQVFTKAQIMIEREIKERLKKELLEEVD